MSPDDKPKDPRGGPRVAGEGKKMGRPAGSGQGRTVVTSSLSLPPDVWAIIDRLRGEQSRSAFISDRVRRMR